MIYRHDFFRTEIALIENQSLRDFVEWFIDHKMPLWFWTSRASSTGKYHPKFTKEEGGLVKHCKAVAQMAYELCRNEAITKTDSENTLSDFAVVAAILHDCAKYGTGTTASHHDYKQHDRNGANLVADAWKEFFQAPIPKGIYNAILRHMGQWGTEAPVEPLDMVVHLADYVTSRTMLDCPEIVRDYHEVYGELPFYWGDEEKGG